MLMAKHAGGHSDGLKIFHEFSEEKTYVMVSRPDSTV